MARLETQTGSSDGEDFSQWHKADVSVANDSLDVKSGRYAEADVQRGVSARGQSEELTPRGLDRLALGWPQNV